MRLGRRSLLAAALATAVTPRALGAATPTPTATPVLPRHGMTVAWAPSLLLVTAARGASGAGVVKLRVGETLRNATLEAKAPRGEAEVLTQLPLVLVPGQDYEITLRLFRPNHWTQAIAYVHLRAGQRRLFPLLQTATRNPPGTR